MTPPRVIGHVSVFDAAGNALGTLDGDIFG
jgi:hypothetical protein